MARLREGLLLLLYLSVTYQAMSSVLFQEIGRAEKPIYFVRNVLICVEACYQKIKKLALAVIVAVRKLRPYFK